MKSLYLLHESIKYFPVSQEDQSLLLVRKRSKHLRFSFLAYPLAYMFCKISVKSALTETTLKIQNRYQPKTDS